MKKVFDEVYTLDKRCYELFGLSEDILMENAAISIKNFISKKFNKTNTILIVSGSGNNGADGIALARMLHQDYDVNLYLPFGAKSSMAQLQLLRAKKLHINIITSLKKCDIVVDCLFGSGLNRALDTQSINIIQELNKMSAYKISCDIPSGIDNQGVIQSIAFKADVTITMGALKKALFLDMAKDYVGKIKVANLGISSKLYQTATNTFLLEKSDFKAPNRTIQLTNKSTFGHLVVVAGKKVGASVLCAKSGFRFGCGLVSIISKKREKNLPYEIMYSKNIPHNATALAIGMGLAKQYKKEYLINDIPKVIDADLFYDNIILELLKQDNIILTPHPKEFCSLLKITNIANIDIDTLQKNRFEYLNKFMMLYPKVVVVLKGANTLIAYDKKIYINSFGTSSLSFGGSGDVLAGIIGSLLAQGYSIIDSAINGVLAHSLAARKFKKSNYSLTPLQLIKLLSKL
jgi:hydroxyethylthiazole kinase-like uncharacterized protein yjeF